MKILLVHPGASWSTADVEAGLRHGLKHHGVEVTSYRLDQRIEAAHKWLHVLWRQRKKDVPDTPKPTTADVMYHAGIGALEMAIRQRVDAVLVVSAMLLHPDVLIMMRQARLRVTVLFTESPYDHEMELRTAALVDGVWTNERSVVRDFRAVTSAGYLPHGWHPERHRPDLPMPAGVPQHDVVFVGSGFRERIAWFNRIDWSGIDLGLYGAWDKASLNKQVRACVRGEQVSNEYASALYRRARVGLNLYRTSKGFGKHAPSITHAESLSPRAYELAACGAFHISEYRAEVPEVFGSLVPTFSTPAEAEALIRRWVPDAAGRAAIARALPAAVAEASWIERARTVIGDLQALLQSRAA